MLVALALIALPTGAVAQTNAPPGNSAIDEYLETVPGATGNQRPRAPGAPGGTSKPTLTPAQRARLERLGPDGKALADAVDATAPSDAKVSGSAPQPPTAEGRTPLRELIDAAGGNDGGGGMGMVLPAILLATLLGVIALVVVRRRSVS